MRQLRVLHRDRLVGTLAAPDSFRPPITQAGLDQIPVMTFARSRSWLFDVRPRDFRLELRGEGRNEEVVVVASQALGSGDLGCLIGFTADAGAPEYAPDEANIRLADDILRDHRARHRGAR